jgi:hypothetical protein
VLYDIIDINNVKKMDSVLLLFCKKMEVNKFVEIGFIVISNRK